MTIEDLMLRWKEAEKRAVEAELELRALGQLSADPSAAQVASKTGFLRREADGLFGQLMRTITNDTRGDVD